MANVQRITQLIEQLRRAAPAATVEVESTGGGCEALTKPGCDDAASKPPCPECHGQPVPNPGDLLGTETCGACGGTGGGPMSAPVSAQTALKPGDPFPCPTCGASDWRADYYNAVTQGHRPADRGGRRAGRGRLRRL